MPREREEKSFFFNFEKHENTHRALVFRKKNVPAEAIFAGRERSEKKYDFFIPKAAFRPHR